MGRQENRGRNDQGVARLPVDTNAVHQIITTDDPQLLVEQAKHVGKYLAQVGLKTNQIRNIFGTARKLQADWLRPFENETEHVYLRRRRARRQLVLLKPKLAYQAKRVPVVQTLEDWLTASIDVVISGKNEEQEYNNFTRFMDFFEAILAYHAAFGGKQD